MKQWYLRNKYYARYCALIARAQNRKRSVGYTEKHHIVPKFCGGRNYRHNIVRLTPRNHYIAHELLVKCVTVKYKSKASHALWQMSRFTNVRGNKRYMPKSSQFAFARKAKAEAMKGWDPSPYWTAKGRDSYRRKMRVYWRHNSAWNLGLKTPIEIRKKVSIGTRTAMARPEVKAKMLGIPKSKAHRRALSSAAKSRPRKTCQYCNTSCQPQMYNRWHGENCRDRI